MGGGGQCSVLGLSKVRVMTMLVSCVIIKMLLSLSSVVRSQTLYFTDSSMRAGACRQVAADSCSCDWSQSRPCNKDLLNNQTPVICQAQTYHPAHSCSHKVAKIFPSVDSREAGQIYCLEISAGIVGPQIRRREFSVFFC